MTITRLTIAGTLLAAWLLPPAVAAKRPLCGLVTMGSLAFLRRGGPPDNSLREARAHPGVYDGVVLLARWADLEPAPGRFDTAILDQGLRAVQAYNAANPARPLRAKIRVFTGSSAPDWANRLDGGAVDVASDRDEAVISPFWGAAYRDAWRVLQSHLAARYDADPLVGEVAISSCASTTAEPFIIALRPPGIAALHRAGFSDAAYRACLSGAVQDYAAWRQTPLDYTFNTFRSSDAGRPSPDPAFAISVMRAFRAALGARGVIANHGLRVPLLPNAEPIYAELHRLGGPIELQTIGPDVDLTAAMQAGFADGATEIELRDSRAAGGPIDTDAAELRQWDTRFACAR